MPQILKILEYRTQEEEVISVRFPPGGDGVIEWGATLNVGPSQVAVFYRDGKTMATFQPGRYVLTTQNVPVLTKFVTGLVYGSGNTPFRADVYFVGNGLYRDLRWGTPEPIYMPDPVLMQIPIRGNGRFAIRVTEPTLFIPKVMQGKPVFRKQDIEEFLREQYLLPALVDAIASTGKTFVELPRFYREIGMGVKSLLAEEFGSLGLELVELGINSVSTTPEIQATLNRNAQLASEGYAKARAEQHALEAKAAGAAKLAQAGTNYQQVGMTDAMKTFAAQPPGEGGGQSAMGTGVNLGLAMMMPGMMQAMMTQQQQGSAPASNAQLAPARKVDPIEQIKKLKELLDLGAISKEEFEAKKADLMKQI
jgi:membrane protease subunit (stomatin/prohibitin family)